MKILIAVDDSTCSAEAVNSVVERTWPAGSEARVVTAMEPVFVQYGFAAQEMVQAMVEAEKEINSHCKEYVLGYAARLAQSFGANKVSTEVLKGLVADSVLEEAKNWNADLIVVGSHGRKGFEKFFLGSVAEKVACHAPCSVEIIKRKAQNN